MVCEALSTGSLLAVCTSRRAILDCVAKSKS